MKVRDKGILAPDFFFGVRNLLGTIYKTWAFPLKHSFLIHTNVYPITNKQIHMPFRKTMYF